MNLPGLEFWYLGNRQSCFHDWRGRLVWLNSARPITRWMRIKAWLGYPPSDALVSGWEPRKD